MKKLWVSTCLLLPWEHIYYISTYLYLTISLPWSVIIAVYRNQFLLQSTVTSYYCSLPRPITAVYRNQLSLVYRYQILLQSTVTRYYCIINRIALFSTNTFYVTPNPGEEEDRTWLFMNHIQPWCNLVVFHLKILSKNFFCLYKILILSKNIFFLYRTLRA